MDRDRRCADNALTRPWIVHRIHYREQNPLRPEYNCREGNNHVTISTEQYFLSADGKLMPVRQDQPPPDLSYLKQSQWRSRKQRKSRNHHTGDLSCVLGARSAQSR
jgi:hypothetical protein